MIRPLVVWVTTQEVVVRQLKSAGRSKAHLENAEPVC
jgi:hypothetical protein